MINEKQFLEVGRIDPKVQDANIRRHNFAEIYANFTKEEAISQAARCLDCGNPYCQEACPVHNYIPNWLQLVADGRFDKAAEISNQTSALPEICGRICPQDRLCERACTLENTNFEAVSIGAIEKFITDYALEKGFKPKVAQRKIAKKVAIIGAGPAGLACANLLIQSGLKVVVYDKQKEIGGLLTFGIPNFKLDKQVVLKRRQILKSQGVRFVLGVEIGDQIGQTPLEQIDADAIFLAIGTYQAIDGNLQGSHLKGVYRALDYLIAQINQLFDFSKDKKPNYINLKDKVVLVLGGGDTAMDCNRTAIRQGAKKVICAYRRDKNNMPGSRKEFINATEEGVEFLFNAQPIEIIGNNKVKSLKFAKTQLGSEDKNKRQQFELTDEIFEIKADAVIIAFGFNALNYPWFDHFGIVTNDVGLIQSPTEKLPRQSSNPKIFTGGDIYRGSSLVVDAIDDGQKAAKSILNYLNIN